MKRMIISLLTVVMLVMMMLPADIAMARGHGSNNQTATNVTSDHSSIKSFGGSPLVADFVFDLPACPSCSGIVFTDKSTGGIKPYTYDWDFGDGSNSTRKNPRHRYANNGTYTVTLTVTDRAGNVASTSETVTLDSAPKENVEPAGDLPLPPATETPFCTTTGSYTICTDKADYASGDTVHVSGSGFAPGAGLTIRVTRPDGSVVAGDGSFAPWPTAYDAVVADLDGTFGYNYVLDGVQGEYLLEAIAGDEVVASCTFTDCGYNIKAFKFEDKDGNGVQNAGEGPLQGWEFKLYRWEWVGGAGGHLDWVLTSTKTTGSTGYANFGTQLCNGRYKIVETGQDCWTCTNCGAAEIPFCLSSDKIVRFGNQPRCDDGDPCTIDTCVNGTCVHTPIDCDYLDDWYEDGDPYTICEGDEVCTYQDWVYLDYECVEGDCVPTETDWDSELIGCQSCDDLDPCTIDTCVNGTCVHTPIDCDYLDDWYEDGDPYTICEGDEVCTYQDWVYLDYECVEGDCVPTETDWDSELIGCQSCDDLDPCTIDTCVNGTCVHTPIDCDYLDDWYEDGDPYTICEGDEVCTYQDWVYLDYECVEGDCVPTETDWDSELIGCQSCDDLDPCTIDTCVNGTCVHTPIDCDYLDDWYEDGDPYTICEGDEVCTYQDWVYLDYECVEGDCVPTETDWDSELIGCQSCDDLDPCTIDTCVNGTCVHTPIDCDYLDDWYEDGDPYTICEGDEVCTYQDWVYLDYECVEGDCVPTETDWDSELIGCQSCDDLDPCTIDTCVNGTCVHTPIDCDYLDDWYEDGDPYTICEGDEVCTYQDWVYLDYECVEGDCVPTETDWDSELIGCQSCDDLDPCTIDTCVNGTCVHTPIDCDYLDDWYEDGDPYTVCEGDEVCTYQDWVYLDYECVEGDCVPTETDWDSELIGCQSCDDLDPCTIDTCVNGTCVHTPIDCDYLDDWYEDGDPYTICEGDEVCTYQDWVYLDYECVEGDCVPTETDWDSELIGCQSCDDLDPCTIDTCVNGTCVHTPIDCDYLDDWYEDGDPYTICEGDEVCTYQDWVYLDYECVEGDCVPTETDWDSELIGCQSCDDLDPCTIDTCVNGTCVHIWTAPNATASSNSPVNQGATIMLYGGPTGMAGYNWTGPGGWTSNSQNATRPNATTAMAGNYTLVVTNEYGCSDDATTIVEIRVPVQPTTGGGGASCSALKYLTVDWEGNNTTKPLYNNDKLAVDLLGPSPDGSDNLFLGRGTHAPVVDERTYYLVVIRELEEIPPPPENTVALVVFNITPAGAEFDRDILLTLGLNQTQLPANALNITMAYYDDVNGAWIPLEYEAGGPNGVAELTLSAPINHFSIYGVLAELTPTPTPPAHFAASGLSIVPGVEKTIFVTRTGESVTITANVANDGGQEGTYTVELKLNGETVDTQTVILGAGQSQPVSFTRSGLDYGQYEVNVAGLSGTFTASRTINWWLIIGILVAVGLIIWGVVWGIGRRRKAHQVAE